MKQKKDEKKIRILKKNEIKKQRSCKNTRSHIHKKNLKATLEKNGFVKLFKKKKKCRTKRRQKQFVKESSK